MIVPVTAGLSGLQATVESRAAQMPDRPRAGAPSAEAPDPEAVGAEDPGVSEVEGPEAVEVEAEDPVVVVAVVAGVADLTIGPIQIIETWRN